MIITFKINNGFNHYDIDVIAPEKCPHCGSDFVPTVLDSIEYPSGNKYVGVLYCELCSNISFIDVYQPKNQKLAIVKSLYPQKAIFDLPHEIKKFYPDFANFYQQAITAEVCNLKDICGMGLRKALEALIKEYALQKFPLEEKHIKNEFLSATVKRIKNEHIQILARKISWLCNDQVHYSYIKHPEYGLSDIKDFIKALCYFILMEKIFEKANTISNKNN